ncbi:hypothetical protein I6U48_04230 [Clostridium sp. PL3]|uniref:Lipoprotein n=1 Tax=Clostridium thailandense TaxID=2794346 RepID=A0A949TVC2_9CLOT|nr:hypothetical protein [Clostridium thailandense]MBV7272125.1 hypothetical protein [Clostridium thailandense]
MTWLFNKKSIATTALALSLMFAGGCSNASNKSENNLDSTKAKNEANSQVNSVTTSENTTAANNSNSTNKSEDNSKSNGTPENTPKEKTSSSSSNVKDKASSEQNITEKVKNYIINGQGNKPEALKINWSKTFLDKVDVESLYKKYIANGGRADDLESFASYMTLNAPIPANWQELFEKDLYDTYGEKVVRLEHLQDDLYQAYIVKNGSEVPYVAVSARTGYYHG